MGRSQRHMVLEQGNDATGASHVQGVVAPGLLQQADTPAPPLFAGRGMPSTTGAVEAPVGEPGGPLAGSTLTGAVPADFIPPPVPGDNPPVITELVPDTAVIGSEDVKMNVNGTGFTETSVIVFNGGDEPTTFVSDILVTTIVKPSTATTAGVFPVNVRNEDGAISAPANFTFILIEGTTE